MKVVIPIENQLSYNSIPRNKDLKLDIKNSCNVPSRVLVVDRRGNCFVCSCEAWLPISVGQIQDFTTLEQVWNSPVAKFLQDDVAQKKFTHCAVDRCGILIKDQKIINYSPTATDPDDYFNISINIDDSCNLTCPSCRTSKIMITQGQEYEQRLSQVYHMVNLLENFEHPCHITMTGNGDPLASAIMRPLIHNYRPKNNHTIRLFTNGLLLKKQLSDSSILKSITQYFISIDAGSKPVYEIVRQGGRWNNLLENLDWLKEIKKQTNATVLLKFVLQKDNWHDMENFADLCESHGFNGVINRLEDWGTWKDFAKHDVIGNALNPDHASAMQALKHVYRRVSTQLQFNSSLAQLAKETA